MAEWVTMRVPTALKHVPDKFSCLKPCVFVTLLSPSFPFANLTVTDSGDQVMGVSGKSPSSVYHSSWDTQIHSP